MPLDKLATSYVLEYDIHRRKNYKYIYFCPKCVRSYLAQQKEESCKFCQSPVKIVTGGKLYVYFCRHCDKRIEGNEPQQTCNTCGGRLLTLYRWDMLDKKERKKLKAAKFAKSMADSMPKLSRQEAASEAKSFIEIIKARLPSRFSASWRKPAAEKTVLVIKKPHTGRQREEMPSDGKE